MFRDVVPGTSPSPVQVQSSLAAVLLHGKTGDELNTLYCTFENCSDVAKVRGRELCGKHYSRLAKAKKLPDLGECTEPGCLRNANFRGYCLAHRWIHYPEYFKKHGNASKGINVDENGDRRKCSEAACEKTAHCKGLCEAHYSASRRPEYVSPNRTASGEKNTCRGIDGCDRLAIAGGYCYKHWERVKFTGSDVLEDPMSPCPVPGCANLKKRRVTPLCQKCTSFRHRYTLTVDQVIEIFAPERRVCGNPGCGSTEKLHLDHDHSCCPKGKHSGRVSSCGKCVRGWLCHFCNTSLGALQENPRRIQGLLDYLRTHKSP